MQKEIEAILAPAREAGLVVRVEKNKRYWGIHVNGRAGARADGISLARELMQDAIAPPEAAPAPKPKRTPPMQVGHSDEPNDLEIPRFLAPPPVESVPTDLQALAEPGETTEQTRTRLWALYRELQNKIMMALASREEMRLHERLHIHMGWLAAAEERKL